MKPLIPHNIITGSFCLLFFLLSSPCIGYGQDRNLPLAENKTEFGHIPDSLYTMEQYKPFPEAPFFYDFKKLNVSFQNDENSIVAILDYHVRIKVFDSDVRGVSIVAIPYYFERDIEEVRNVRAATYTKEGRRIPLQEEDIRRININSRYNVIEFTMPDVEDGAVLEYSYQIRRRYIEELPDFHLSHQVPTALAEVSITYPGYLRYDTIRENYDGEIEYHSQKIDTSSVAKIFTVPQPDPILRESWTARNVPPIEEENYISSIDDYRGKLKFKLSEFGIPRQKLENSWKLVVAELRRNQNVLEQAARNRRARQTGADIARRFDSQEAVQDSIFSYLNSRARFDGSKSPYSEVSDEEVLSGEPADQAAINQTLLAMLQGAGIEAYPLLISTRQFGQINRSFPSFFQFNGQLTYSVIDGHPYFMDASFPNSQPNLIPVDTYNEMGLLLKPESYEWKNINPANSLFAIDIDVNATLNSEGDLQGEIRAESSGYPVQVIRQKRLGGATIEQVVREAVFDGYRSARIDVGSFSKLDSYERPLIFSADFQLPDYATSFTDGLQFRPMVVGYLMSNPFNEGNRDLPVTLDAPEKLDLTYEITIPQGFSFPEGRQNRSIELPGASFTEHYDIEGRTIRYEFHIDISRKQFEPEVYPQLLNLYERWVQISNSSWLIKRN